MDELRKKLIHLSHCRHISWNRMLKLLQHDSTLKDLYDYSPKQLQKILSVSPEQSSEIKKDLQTIPIQDILNKYEDHHIQCITLLDKEYPARLRHIYDSPWVLYAKGDISLLQYPRSLSVVGTRKPTSYGYEALQALLTPLIKEGWLVVSGLAAGIDTGAHELAIQSQGKTIAVLGGGIYNIYPKQNIQLAAIIARSHLLLSEYPPAAKPKKWYFPMRNRIISGLTLGTIVVQARERSGSFITADQALQQGREVFAVPGSIFEEFSAGTNKLIQLGAKLVSSAHDIRNELYL